MHVVHLQHAVSEMLRWPEINARAQGEGERAVRTACPCKERIIRESLGLRGPAKQRVGEGRNGVSERDLRTEEIRGLVNGRAMDAAVVPAEIRDETDAAIVVQQVILALRFPAIERCVGVSGDKSAGGRAGRSTAGDGADLESANRGVVPGVAAEKLDAR